MCKKPLVFVFFIILCVFFVVLTGFVAISAKYKIKSMESIGGMEGRVITVSETGEVFATPDLAIISFSVVNEAENVASAMSENTKSMNEVIKAVKEEGIEEKDIKTTNFSLYPIYRYPEHTGSRILSAYGVNQTIEVKIRNMDKIGAVIVKATGAGANQSGDLNLTIDNKDELKNQARKEAINKAKEKAKSLANQLGVDLGKIVSFSENSYYYYDAMSNKGMGGGAESSKAPAPQIEAGQNKITASVMITYKMK